MLNFVMSNRKWPETVRVLGVFLFSLDIESKNSDPNPDEVALIYNWELGLNDPQFSTHTEAAVLLHLLRSRGLKRIQSMVLSRVPSIGRGFSLVLALFEIVPSVLPKSSQCQRHRTLMGVYKVCLHGQDVGRTNRTKTGVVGDERSRWLVKLTPCRDP